MEALARVGIMKCFHQNNNIGDEEIGIEYLAKAASKGHKAAAYLYGMISFCRHGSQKGNEIFNSYFDGSTNLLECLL